LHEIVGEELELTALGLGKRELEPALEVPTSRK
jgi:hypothetical protein